MHAIETFLGRPEVERLGWVLLHFVWQGAIGAAVVAAALFAMRRASANARYLLCCAGLLTMTACSPVTWLAVGRRTFTNQAASNASSFATEQTPTAVALEPLRHSDDVALNPPAAWLDHPKPATTTPRRAAETAPVAASPAMSWQQRLAASLPWIAAAWLAGVTILSTRLAIGWSAVRRLRRAASPSASGERHAVLERLSQRLGIRWPVKLLETALVEVPTMIGWLRPAILWPPSMLAGLSIEQFESLLAHELAHIRRHDYLVNLFQTAIETLLFYHPAVWWISNRIRQERECCCDDLAIATCGNRVSYARALAAVEELRPRPRQFALAADGGRLLTRIRRILGQPAPRSPGRQHWLLGITLSVSLLIVVVAVAAKLAIGDQTATAPDGKAADPQSKSKPDDAAPASAPSGKLGFDLSVRKVANSEANELLPDDLGEKIARLPHVTQVWGSLTSNSPPVFALPVDAPAFKNRKIVEGRNLRSTDRRKVVVGKFLPTLTGEKLGATIKFHGVDFEVVGVSDSPRSWENYEMLTQLADLQPLLRAEHQVNEFLIAVDGPQDASGKREAQIAELRERILALGQSIHSDLTFFEPGRAKKPGEPANPFDTNAVEVSGHVVDDETGKPVPNFHIQGGEKSNPDRIQWGMTESWRDSSARPGDFEMQINWKGGWRGRIVAGGYVPERILSQPPDPTKARIQDIVVRMKRGRTVSGRLLDHSGKPIASASLFVIGDLNTVSQIRIGDGKAFARDDRLWTEDLSMAPFKTDADGKFVVTGIGWDANFMAISCPALDLWIVHAPSEADSRNFEIRLPQPAKLVVHYDIPGAPYETEVALWPKSNERDPRDRGPEGPGTYTPKDSSGRPLDWTADCYYSRIGTVKQHGELVFDNLPPGEYVIQRVKEFERILGVNGKVALDRREVKLAAGGAMAIDCIRQAGNAVSGEIVGLGKEQLRDINPVGFVTIEPTVGAPTRSEPADYALIEAVYQTGAFVKGKFTTERLPPGKYRIVAKLFNDLFSPLPTLDATPLFIGEATIEVPENGETTPVKIEMQPFVKPAKTPPKRDPPPAAPAPKSTADPSPLTRILSGHVVDADTGQPVRGFIYEEATFDEQSPARFHWNGEAIGPGSQRDGAFGMVVKNRPGKPVWSRIVAPGYVPQPIGEKPIVLADDSVLDKFEVRMHRGKELTGRVVDAAGKPVAAAAVYLLRNQGRRQVVRDPAVTAPNQQFEMLAMTHAATDSDGRFKMTGWDAESGRIAILSGEMNLWVTPIPDDVADWTIRLPNPATIECLVDDDSGERQTLYDLDFVTTGRKGWKMLRAYQFNLESKGGRLSVANHTPGEYELTRRRRVSVGDYDGEFRLADVKLQVDPSATFAIDLRHPVGWPITGQVTGLKDLGLSGAVISVEPPGDVKRGAMTFDAVTCGEDGRFETSRLSPGKYRVHVDAYHHKPPTDPRAFRGGLELPPAARMPDFTADMDVTITKDEPPAKLKPELKKGGESRAFRELIQYHEQPHPAMIDQFTAPPWSVGAGEQDSGNAGKSNPQSNEESHAVLGNANYQLIVQKLERDARLDHHIPMEVGDRLRQLPHVTRVDAGLIDVVSFDEHNLPAVLVTGFSPNASTFKEWKIIAGRLPKVGDVKVVILGTKLARQMQKKVGDKVSLYGEEASVVGIFESKHEIESGSVAMLLSQLQGFMDRPKQVSSFLIGTDIRRDDSTEHKTQFDNLRNQIESLDKGLAAIAAPVDKDTAVKQPPEQSESAHPSPSPAKATSESAPLEVHGQVIDDATGKPIERFEQQGGQGDPKHADKITWGYYLRSGGGSEGRFDASIDWNNGWRARIIAGGYVPQPILIEPPKPGQTKIEGVVVRMKRGRGVSGRVLDHAGNPVKDASLFVVGSRPVDITGGKAIANGAHGRGEDQSVVRYSTDADGKFNLTGIGEDSTNIAVSCPTVDLWIVPVPPADQLANGLEIRLPEPGKLVVHYDIPGGPDAAELFFQLHTWDQEGWKGVDNRRYPTVKQHGELVVDNMTPGLYEVVRLSNGGFLDRRQVTIDSGKTLTTDFVRKSGAPITGKIIGLDREEVQEAKPTRISISVHKPGDEKNPLAPTFDNVGIAPFDKNGKPSDGSFKTGIIPPGDYRVTVNVFIEETPKQRHRTGLIPPGFVGEAKVTVPEQGNPEPVQIELKRWAYRGTENRGAQETPKKDAVDTAVKRGIEYLARKKAEQDAAAKGVPDEVTISVDPALDAELRALDAMRGGTSTNFEQVDEIGRKLLERYQTPKERGQIYYALLQVHGQSGLVTPEHIIEYSTQSLKYPLGSRQELMVYIYWGDTLNVRKTEKPWPEQRSQAAEIYLKGLKRVWQYNAPEQPPELPEPPPVDDSPDGPEHKAAVASMKHYIELKNKADFIKELIYHRHIFIRQIADMYHRRPATGAEIEALRKQAAEILNSDAAVARLMAAVEADPKKAAEKSEGRVTKTAIAAVADDKEAAKKANEKSGEERPWSELVNGVKARLSLERGKDYKGSATIYTYLELWNYAGKSDALSVPLNPGKVEFKVTDATGKELPIKSLDYGVDTYYPNLEIPKYSQLRFYLGGSIVETAFKEPVTFLSLALDRGCVFPHSNAGEYLVHAELTIAKTDDRFWHGTIKVPPVRVPLPK